MSGDWLALGAVAALAAATAARGSRSMVRTQRVPRGFTVDPLEFVADTVLEDVLENQDPDDVGFFHVTTNLPAVLAQGRLKSRAQLRSTGTSYAGLGGGIRDQAAGQISVGLLRHNAERVLETTRMMAMAVHGQTDGRSALRVLNGASDRTLSILEGAMDWMDEGSECRASMAFSGLLNKSTQEVLNATPGADLYEALRRYEGLLAKTLSEWMSNYWISEDELVCGATVGFTEPAHRFERVRPENIGLVQLAGRIGARVDLVPSECEVRFYPADLVIVESES